MTEVEAQTEAPEEMIFDEAAFDETDDTVEEIEEEEDTSADE